MNLIHRVGLSPLAVFKARFATIAFADTISLGLVAPNFTFVVTAKQSTWIPMGRRRL